MKQKMATQYLDKYILSLSFFSLLRVISSPEKKTSKKNPKTNKKKLQLGLILFQLQHCLDRMTVIQKSSGKHNRVSSLLRRLSAREKLAVNCFGEQRNKIVLESTDGLDPQKKHTKKHTNACYTAL